MRLVQRRQPGLEYGLILLASQTLNFGIDKIPPITLIGIIIQSLLYSGIIKVPWNAEDVCVSSLKVLNHKDWRSFLIANFEHGSDMHLYYNMVSFLLKGSYLEPMYGALNFLILTSILSIGCSAMYVFMGYVLLKLTKDYSYYSSCAIGFSSILFSLKTIVICEEKETAHEIEGFKVPSKFAVWTELVLIYLLVPNSSFVGHFSGILVGCVYCYTFIGEMIDSKMSFITGQPIIHEERFYQRRIFSF